MESSVAPVNEPDKVNILLIDDQPAKLLSYEVVLAGIGETLIKASSACEAFECLLKNEIGLILIDVCMPDLDGFELAALIREHPRFQRIGIIFVSAVIDNQFSTNCGAMNLEPSITFRFRWSPNCCAPKSRCSWTCIARLVNWSGSTPNSNSGSSSEALRSAA